MAVPTDMQRSLWGPPLWTAIHVVSFNFPPDPSASQRHVYAKWIALIGRVIPCAIARRDFPKHVWKALPHRTHLQQSTGAVGKWLEQSGVMDTRTSFGRFCYALHKQVNRTLGKPTLETYKQVRHRYEGFRAGCLTARQESRNKRLGNENGCTREKLGRKRVKSRLDIRTSVDSKASTLVVQPSCLPHVKFCDADLESADGFQTAFWGPLVWTAIHAISFSFPEQPTAAQRRDYVDWLLLTGQILPCGYCRENFQCNLEVAVSSMASEVRVGQHGWKQRLRDMFRGAPPDSMAILCCRLHAEVNRMLQKLIVIQFHVVRRRYRMFHAKRPPKYMTVTVCPRDTPLAS